MDRVCFLPVVACLAVLPFTCPGQSVTLPENVAVSGRVLLPSGQPAAGARITVLLPHYDEFGLQVDVGAKATAAPDGTFAVDVKLGGKRLYSGLMLAAEHPQHALGWQTIRRDRLADGSAECELKLDDPQELRGRVVTPEGEPLKDAVVTVPFITRGSGGDRTFLLSPAGTEFLRTSTQPDGTFVLGGVPASASLMLRVRAPGQGEAFLPRTRKDLSWPQWEFVTASKGPFDIEVPRGASVSGTVTLGAGGAPVAQAEVVLRRQAFFVPTETVTTDAQGRFSFRDFLPDGPRVMVLPMQEGRRQAIPRPLVLGPGDSMQDCSIPLLQCGTARITVHTDLETPLANASVQLQHSELEAGTREQLSEKGLAELHLLPGDWNIRSMNSPFGWHRVEEAFAVTAGETTEHHMTIPGFHSCRVTATTAEGTPLAGADLMPLPSNGRIPPVTTDEQGRARVIWYQREGSTSRPSTIGLCHPAHNLVAAAPIPGNGADLTVAARPGVTVAGRITNPDGSPAPDVSVSVKADLDGCAWTGLNQPSTTGADGTFAIKALPPDAEIRLRVAEVGGFGPAALIVPPQASGAVKTLDSHQLIAADQSVSGVVRDEKGAPMVGFNVTATGEGQPVRRRAVVDETGDFTVTGLCPGAVTLHASANTRGHRSKSVETEAGATDIVFEFPALPIIDVVARDSEAKPVEGVKLRVAGYAAGRAEPTDAEGRTRVSWNPRHGSRPKSLSILATHTEARLFGVADSASDATAVQVTMTPTIEVDGTFTDVAGNPIQHVVLRYLLRPTSGGTETAVGSAYPRSRRDGTFSIKRLPRNIRVSFSVDSKRYERRKWEHTFTDADAETFTFPPIALRRADQKVTGTVVDAEGVPVAGVRVSVSGDGQPYSTATSDADGRFAFEGLCGGALAIGANYSRDGVYASTSVKANTAAGDIRVELRSLATFHGCVVDAAGNAVAGARVLMSPGMSSDGGALSGTDGAFQLRWSKRHSGFGRQRTLGARHDQRDLVALVSFEQASESSTLTLSPGAVLTVKVVTEKGEPVSEAEVHLSVRLDSHRHALSAGVSTGDNGSCTFRAVPRERELTVRVTSKKYGPANVTHTIQASDPAVVVMPDIVLRAVDAELSGIVVDAGGQPFEGVRVNTHGAGQPSRSTKTDSDGKFTLPRLSGGTVDIMLYYHEGDASVRATHKLNTADSPVRLVLEGLRYVSGRVVDAKRTPLVGAEVALIPSMKFSRAVKTGADGTFRLPWAKQQRGTRPQQMSLAARHGQTSQFGTLPWTEGMRHATIVLKPAGTLTFKVVDAAGSPIDTPSIWLSAELLPYKRTTLPSAVAADGVTHTCRAVPRARDLALNVSKIGRAQVTRELRLPWASPGDDAKQDVTVLPDIVLRSATGKVTGTVVDAEGVPVRGAQILWMGEGAGTATESKADGSFVLTGTCEGPIKIQVLYNRPGAQTSVSLETTAGGKPVRAVLKSLRRITGCVRTADGSAVAGAAVALMPITRLTSPVEADSKGEFVFHWSAERHPKGLTGTTFVARHDERNLFGMLPWSTDTKEPTIVVGPAGTLTFKVIDTAGNPIDAPGILLSAQLVKNRGTPFPCAAAPDGTTWTCRGLPRACDLSLSVAKSGCALVQRKLRLPAISSADDAREGPTALPDIVLRRTTAKLAGTVVDAEGVPVGGARVSSRGEGQPGRSVESAANGSFVLTQLCEGPVTVQAYYNRHGVHTSVSLQTRTGEKPVRVVLESLHQLVGHVRTADGSPVAGAAVALLPISHLTAPTRTDVAGKFVLFWSAERFRNGVPKMTLVARHEGQNLFAILPWNEKVKAPVIPMESGRSITFRVTDEEGKGIPEARAFVQGALGPSTTTSLDRVTSSADGSCRFTALPPAIALKVWVDQPGYGRVEQEAAPQAETDGPTSLTAQLPDMVLRKADATLRGTVVDAAGTQLNGATVSVSGPGQSSRSTKTDRDGKFTLEGICRGPLKVYLRYSREGLHASHRQEVATAQSPVRLVLESLRTVTGRLVDADGAPVEGAEVILRPATDEQPPVQSADDGSFRLQWSRSRFGSRLPRLIFSARHLERNLVALEPWPESQTEAELTLRPGAALRGTVHTPDGTPIPKVLVYVSVRKESEQNAYPMLHDAPAAGGDSLVISAVPRGMVTTVIIGADGFGTAKTQLQTPPPSNEPVETELEPFILRPADQTIAGIVLGVDEKPVPEAWVYLAGQGQPPTRGVRTGADGRFVLAPVCAGSAVVHASSRAGPSRRGYARVQGGDQDVKVIVKGPDSDVASSSVPDIAVPKLGEDFDPKQALYWCDFEGEDAAPGWSTEQVYELEVEGEKRRMLGQFGGPDQVALGLAELPAHTHIRLYCELFLLRSWDGNQKGRGPDVMAIRVANGPRLLFNSFCTWSGSQSHPFPFRLGAVRSNAGAVKFDTELRTWDKPWTRNAYYPMVFTFPHVEPDLTLFFAGLNLGVPEDEAWCLDNVGIQLLTEAPASAEVTDADLLKAWEGLGERDAAKAWERMHALRSAGDRGVALIIEKTGWEHDEELRSDLLEICDVLNYNDNLMWQEAFEEFRSLGPRTLPLLMYCLDARRFGPAPPHFLDEHLNLAGWQEATDADALRNGRAAFILEQAWTPAARRALLVDGPDQQ